MDNVRLPSLPEGPEARFAALYASSADDVIRFVQRRTVPAQVEDIVADAFLVAWRRIEDVPKSHSEARAWLFGIARHCLLNTLRGASRREALAVRVTDTPRSVPITATDVVETRVDLVAAWRTLDPADQETLALTVFDDLTSREAGQILGISPPAYRVRLMRARHNLRRQMNQELGS